MECCVDILRRDRERAACVIQKCLRVFLASHTYSPFAPTAVCDAELKVSGGMELPYWRHATNNQVTLSVSTVGTLAYVARELARERLEARM